MRIVSFLLAGAAATACLPCVADTILEVDAVGQRAARSAGIPAAVAANTLVVASVAMFDAANAIEPRYRPYRAPSAPPAGADPDAAALGAGCAVLGIGFASQAEAIATACDALAGAMPATEAVRAGRAFGEASGKASAAARQAETKPLANAYRPRTTAGVYVATPLPLGFDTASAKPWAMASPDQFRPGPPPALDGDAWARDFNEVKALGARNSAMRSPEQTATALFWASNGPAQFMDSVPELPFRGSTVDRARLLAFFYMAIADASIAVFDAKNAYDFWRPITAIRNGDEDGNAATERDPAWMPLLDTPLHQEYPCAHCTVTAAIATALAAAVGNGASTMQITLRPAGPAAATARPRTWATTADVMMEVSNARVWAGVHYRTSTNVGLALGQAVGSRVAQTQLVPLVDAAKASSRP